MCQRAAVLVVKQDIGGTFQRGVVSGACLPYRVGEPFNVSHAQKLRGGAAVIAFQIAVCQFFVFEKLAHFFLFGIIFLHDIFR